MPRFDDPLVGSTRCTHRAGGFPLVTYLIRSGGVDPDVAADLPCSDVHLLARTLMRSAFVARADLTVLAETTGRPTAERFTRGSLVFAWTVLAMTTAALMVLCGALGVFR